jgi:hypothetical protein
MVANLQTDIEDLDQIIYRSEFAVNCLDTFLMLIASAEISQIPTGKLYWYGLWGGYIRGFEPNDATYQQMRNSGSLRYFNNAKLEKQIAEYDQLLRGMRTLNEIDRLVYLETRKARAGIFDFKYNLDANEVVQAAVYNGYRPAIIDSFIRLNRPILTTDKIQFNQYAELCRSRNIRQQLKNATEARTLAISIVNSLKEEFHVSEKISIGK